MPAPTVVALTRREGTPERFYFRVGHNDHLVLEHLLAAGKLQADGLMLDARRHQRHESLRQQAQQSDVATCLDTQAMELAMPGTNSKGHAALPWAGVARGSPKVFSERHLEQLVRGIVEQSKEGKFDQIMAPTHYLPDLSRGWWDLDDRLARELRVQLDDADLDVVKIVYPLAVHGRLFYEQLTRAMFKSQLRALPVDMLSLRIQPFGHDSGPRVLRNMIEACWDLRETGKPIMIERAGFLGLVLFAFSAVDIISSSLIYGDAFDLSRLQKPAAATGPKHFKVHEAVYIEALGSSVSLEVAKRLMDTPRGKLGFACQQVGCCPNGAKDMFANPARHSALGRQRQYAELERLPASMRAEHFIQHTLTTVCDRLARAADLDESFKKAQRRMLSVKEMLVDLQRGIVKISRRGSAHRPMPPSATAQIITLTPRDPRGR